MVLIEEVEKYLHYCEFQKELDSKTITTYRADLRQFIKFMETLYIYIGKKEISEYLRFIQGKYKQKTVKRKIASVKAFFGIWRKRRLLNWILSIRLKLSLRRKWYYLKSSLERLLCNCWITCIGNGLTRHILSGRGRCYSVILQ